MFAAFEQAALLRPVTLRIALNDAESYNLEDVHAIDEERLAKLDGGQLERLHAAGFLRPAFMAAASLANVSRLIELKNRRARVQPDAFAGLAGGDEPSAPPGPLRRRRFGRCGSRSTRSSRRRSR